MRAVAIVIVDGGEGTKYSNASQLMPTIQKIVANHRIRYPRPKFSVASSPPMASQAPRFHVFPAASALKHKMPEMTIAYEDAAEVILDHLAPNGRFSRTRVGVALSIGLIRITPMNG